MSPTARQMNFECEQFDEALREFDAILDLDGTYEDAPALRGRLLRASLPKRC